MATEDLLPPLLPVDAQHHGAWVVIAAAMGLTITLASLSIRLYVRLSISPSFGIDDIVFLAATICTVIQNGTIFSAVSKGFGSAIEQIAPGNLQYVQKALFTADFFYLVALYLTKCCVVTVFLRLTPVKSHNWATWATFAFSTAWMIASVLLVGINCALNMPFEALGGNCPSLFLRWQLISAFDIMIEGCLFCLAVYLVFGLQMSMARKLVVLSTFGSRIPLVIFVGFRLHVFNKGYRAPDRSLDMVDTAVWTQIALHFSVIACTSYCLKPFMAAVSTNYGVAGGTSSGTTGGTSSYRKRHGYATDEAERSATGSYALKELGNNNAAGKLRSFDHADAQGNTHEPGGPVFRCDEASHQAAVTAASIASNESTKMIIKKDVAYTIQYGPRENPKAHWDEDDDGPVSRSAWGP
ncbi:hypothetical protein LOZ53_004449 [Ophidiomyces ophidiicola]|uniref:uncharacterized protein n=1 Tax=Ophidiomyces ophidiicola TaxID=1387563 RepID=UPI0020C20CC9|nr:uncharacterized protein LOZ57_006851 [Ophidiomyces ophidiicola]KAI1935901.1 hypothetical protein LOZ57_006851 [Ophidiomyces ophidiicola]KAI1945014.1 hypothetical protein LOZ62_003880 [Ophidiomyces ophidiicola]KAI1947025.1 hypothetical protein LOZ59_006709 [Ophidiomyces ophidiicola]KAI1965132.1 hypothetical protein LOZ56_006100 [Ophidiomyces ophidiicola]KAI1971602.1 hypothetical protein LOZ55_006150 [Ophidiomyces ophidiicola]